MVHRRDAAPHTCGHRKQFRPLLRNVPSSATTATARLPAALPLPALRSLVPISQPRRLTLSATPLARARLHRFNLCALPPVPASPISRPPTLPAAPANTVALPLPPRPPITRSAIRRIECRVSPLLTSGSFYLH